MANPISKEVGERVRKLRRERSLSQDALAAATGLTPQTIRNLESGATYPRMATLEKLAGVFEVPVRELLGMERSAS